MARCDFSLVCNLKIICTLDDSGIPMVSVYLKLKTSNFPVFRGS